ncbi:polysaccharide lyase family 1 protein [Cylindrobasidium torrendii FP15055 ss-10]|uniref:Polysaccharide lyase family 1 protein n=1 Tax=Cylindrobasidium torrendii FP15055 ss-10 TaxID=1314674 RepID=A0A0D7B6I6_9AGAR|nr:polysaccharide lyase family 1 protein [Cylindrobasidium torrendii FP15055 ss-10]
MFAFAALTLLAASVSAQVAVDSLIGYGVGTTGGGSATPVRVSSCADLASALDTDAAAVVEIATLLKDCGVVDIKKGDKTVIGVGSEAGLTGGGIRVRRTSNVIIRNLAFSLPQEGDDLIALDNAVSVWVDHNTFTNAGITGDKDYYDGLLDISHASDQVTVSWNVFRDHWKGSLIGHSDNNGDEDTGFLHVSYHHNLWDNVNSRTPSVRFGTAHVFNSVYQNIPTSGINSRMGAQVLVESNVFTDVELAVVTDLDSDEEGYAVEKNNVFTNSETRITQEGLLTPPYDYDLDDTANLASILATSAGVGIIN